MKQIKSCQLIKLLSLKFSFVEPCSIDVANKISTIQVKYHCSFVQGNCN